MAAWNGAENDRPWADSISGGVARSGLREYRHRTRGMTRQNGIARGAGILLPHAAC
jgi:hypothetical protein